MDWDAIRRKYPDDATGIDRARRVYAAVTDRLSTLEIPRADALDKPGAVVEAIPYGILAGLLREVWVEVLGREPEVDLEEALRAFASDEPTADSPEDVQDLLPVFLRPAVTGYLSALREKSGDPGRAEGLEGACPFCGTYPRMALESEAERQLVCLVCGRQWRFRRIGCPFCGNNDHETLGYFEVEGVDGVRVQYCEQCRHYLKVVDTRKRAILDAETEDVLSLDLDTAAQGEGYL